MATGQLGSPLGPVGRGARIGFAFLAWVFLICVIVQVFLAGMAIFVTPADWRLHTLFVHWFRLVPIAMLVLAFIGRLPYSLRWLSAALFALIFVQYATGNIPQGQPAIIGAIHPVSALVIFWAALVTVRRSTALVRGSGRR